MSSNYVTAAEIVAILDTAVIIHIQILLLLEYAARPILVLMQ